MQTSTTQSNRLVTYYRSAIGGAWGHNTIAGQIDRVTEMPEVQGENVIANFIDEGMPSGTMDRPGLNEIKSLVEAKACDIVVVSSLDRISRDAREVGDFVAFLHSHGVRLITADGGFGLGGAELSLILGGGTTGRRFYVRRSFTVTSSPDSLIKQKRRAKKLVRARLARPIAKSFS